MDKKQSIDLAGKQSKTSLWLIGLILLLIIAGFIAYIVMESIKGVKAARKAYYDQVASMKEKDIQITVIEGWRKEQIALELEKNGVILADDFLVATKNLEGKLFPDTYRFFANSKADQVVKKFTDNYNQKINSLGTVDDDTLILASIVEREAAEDSERAKIAGVYLNRIKSGMLLEADPTTQYARDNQEMEKSTNWRQFTFWQGLSRDETQTIDSPFNTYKYPSLPPEPIANPGIKSIEAALNPEEHNYYFFFHAKDDGIIFSRNLEEHNYNKSIHGIKGI